ncbi:MAG: AraC family transcriptional regulator [Dysgonamonadaceae bacterium]|jgi:AraC-like DNA-binding protein|nr:AraC family transcriptional regulator [Dysgonamonadaceae bacterium]
MKEAIHIKYLIANEQDASWGLTINTVGYQHIMAGTSYPPGNHPTRYLFSTQKGRVLDEYQLLYLSRGKGCFTSLNCKPTEIRAGHFFLLYPGEWHNYEPLKECGWDEYWIGFSGVNMNNRIQNGFFNKSKPIFNVGINEEIVHLYKQAIHIAQEQEPGFQQMLAGIVNYLLGLAYSRDKLNALEDLQVANQINQAKIIMLDSYTENVNLESIATQLNMSYSWFRRVFKQYTGFSPSQYVQELRLQRSKDLLTHTSKSIKEIAYNSGFENSDYFCTAFRRKTGSTPTMYRDFTRGKHL